MRRGIVSHSLPRQ